MRGTGGALQGPCAAPFLSRNANRALLIPTGRGRPSESGGGELGSEGALSGAIP